MKSCIALLQSPVRENQNALLIYLWEFRAQYIFVLHEYSTTKYFRCWLMKLCDQRVRVRLDTAENWKLKLKTEKYCSRIIFKCVNTTVGPIFNEKITEKWNLLVCEQCTMCPDWLRRGRKVKLCGYCSCTAWTVATSPQTCAEKKKKRKTPDAKRGFSAQSKHSLNFQNTLIRCLGDDVNFFFLSKEDFIERKPHNWNMITQSPSPSSKTLLVIETEMDPIKRVQEAHSTIFASLVLDKKFK